MQNISKLCAGLGLVAALSGCAADNGRYASLALRPFETGAAVPSPVFEPTIPTPIRAAMSPAMLAALRDNAFSAHAAFLRKEQAAGPIASAAAGQSIESAARARALVTMADLRSQRGATSAALAQIDLLTAEAASVLAPDPALVALQAEVAALLAREDAGIARLWQAMGS